MEIVIDIPDQIYNQLIETGKYLPYQFNTKKAIKEGIPLPEGHGDLIDRNELRCENADFDTYNDYCTMFDEIDNALPIIEADKVESEE